MNEKSTKIVVIHDGLIPKIDPLLIELEAKFSNDSVIHFSNSNEGLEYVLKSINQKIIVLLDINFSNGELSGIQVFESIREKTDLIYVIMITARSLKEIDNDDLISMINNDALAIENVSNYPKILDLVDKASHKLDVRISSALEQWIVSHPEQSKDQPYILTRNGHSYSLNQLLEEIRLQTNFGKEVEKDILLLAIDMLSRGKKKIDG